MANKIIFTINEDGSTLIERIIQGKQYVNHITDRTQVLAIDCTLSAVANMINEFTTLDRFAQYEQYLNEHPEVKETLEQVTEQFIGKMKGADPVPVEDDDTPLPGLYL